MKMERRSTLGSLIKSVIGLVVIGGMGYASYSWFFGSTDYGSVPGASEVIGTYELDTAWLDFLTTKEIKVTAFDDPKVKGLTCHVSDVVAGGLTWADDPSNASIACRQTGPVVIPSATEQNPWGNLADEGEDVFGKTKGWFKGLRVIRWVDKKRKTLVYVVFTPRWGGDSNKNVISTVSLYSTK